MKIELVLREQLTGTESVARFSESQDVPFTCAEFTEIFREFCDKNGLEIISETTSE